MLLISSDCRSARSRRRRRNWRSLLSRIRSRSGVGIDLAATGRKQQRARGCRLGTDARDFIAGSRLSLSKEFMVNGLYLLARKGWSGVLTGSLQVGSRADKFYALRPSGRYQIYVSLVYPSTSHSLSVPCFATQSSPPVHNSLSQPHHRTNLIPTIL